MFLAFFGVNRISLWERWEEGEKGNRRRPIPALCSCERDTQGLVCCPNRGALCYSFFQSCGSQMHAGQAQAASSLIHLLLPNNGRVIPVTIIKILNRKIKKMQAEAILNTFRYSVCVEKTVCN